jgi:predicted DNA-binding protein (UPF0251 family)
VEAIPGRTCFRPQGEGKDLAQEILLSLDEFEAIRLADLEGLYQEEAAVLMKVSRQTFGRIVAQARGKLADVLVNGKTLRIAGGPVTVAPAGRTRCPRCHRGLAPGPAAGPDTPCPHCQRRGEPQPNPKGEER